MLLSLSNSYYLAHTPRYLIRYAILSYHPFINPIVNPADILPVNGIPKLVIANEEAVAAGHLHHYRY